MRGVVHVHSDLSTGDFSLEELVALADRQGIGALLLAENYLLRVEYGLPPFRALTRVSREERSVDGRVEHYLARVAEAQARPCRTSCSSPASRSSRTTTGPARRSRST